MSNPTIATKLKTLVQGIFGRKDPVVTTVQDKKDATPAPETAETVKTAETPVETPEATTEAPQTEEKKEEVQEKAESTTADEPKADEKLAEQADAAATTEDKPEAPEAALVTEAAEAAELVEDGKNRPATSDVPEDGSALAEEIVAAEAHTRVASDDVLEKVRKGAAPAAEDLAVPTYNELTLPSIRARLRKLSLEQVHDLRAYEVAHDGRPEFIKMYDNRIAKLEGEAGA